MSIRKNMVSNFIESVVKLLDSELYNSTKELLTYTEEGMELSDVCEHILNKLTQSENIIRKFIETIHENPSKYSFSLYSNYINAMITIFRANMALILLNNGEMNLYSEESIIKLSKFRLTWFYCFYCNEKRSMVQFEDDPENLKVKDLLKTVNDIYNEYSTLINSFE